MEMVSLDDCLINLVSHSVVLTCHVYKLILYFFLPVFPHARAQLSNGLAITIFSITKGYSLRTVL